jgi:PAS domain S-box-containing protein
METLKGKITASAPLLILDASGEIVSVNDAFERTFGYGRADIEGNARWPFLPPDRQETVRTVIRRALLGDPPEAFDLPVTCGDGSVREFRWNAVLLQDGDDPRRDAVALLGIEAGSRRREESGLGEIEDLYRTIFDNSGISLMYSDEKMTIVLANREFEKMLGYTREQVEGRMSWTALIPCEDDLERMKKYHRLRRIDPGSAPGMYTAKVQTRDGRVLDALIRVTMVPGTRNSLISLVDITERRLAEEAIRRSEEKYRALVENMQDVFYRCDLRGTLTYVSPAGPRLFGYGSPEEMIGRNIAADFYLDPARRDRLLAELDRDGRVTNHEMMLKRRDGSPLYALLNAHYFHDADGNVMGIEGILRDITQRRQAEEEADRLASIVRHSGELVSLCDPGGRMVFLNEAGSRMLGIDPPDVEKTNIAQILPGPMKELVWNETIPKLLEGESWEGELEYVNRKTGGKMYAHAFAFPIRDPDNLRVKYLANISLDITRQKESERILRESEERLRAITKNMPGTVFRFYAKDDGEFGMSYVSERLLRMLGIPEEADDLFPRFLSAVHEEDRQRFLASVRDAVGSAGQWDFEGRFVVPSGKEMWFQGLATPTRQEDRLVFDGILLDVTDRKLAEEALEKRLVSLTRPLDDASGIAFEDLFNVAEIQKLQEDFARATGVASIITHVNGTPITAPSMFTCLCNDIIRKTEKGLANCYKSDAALGRLSTKGPTIQPCMSGGLWDAGAGISVGGRHIANWLIGQVRDETQTEERMRGYAREIGADEEEVVAAFRKVPSMSREQFGNVAQALYTLANQLSTLAYQNVQQARFITERRQAEEERRKLEEQLHFSEKMKAIGQLAGGIAHDFNNILMGILGNVALVQMKCDPEGPDHKRLAQIEEHVKRGANLTRQLLGFAREGKYEVKALCLNDLIRKSAQLFLETRKEIEVEFRLQEGLHPVEADAGQIEQVLLNIFINAAHAMPGGGKLRIRTENVTLGEAEARASETEAGDFVRISIADTGTGMDRETLGRIFEPFFTTKADEGGTGLGLPSAYGIVRNHGGAINAHSEPGHGATFEILLPSSEKPVEKEETKPENATVAGRGGILLVDDEPMILESVSFLLESLGYTVYRAGTGQEAVSLFSGKREEIDLVILDMILPGMSGAGVLTKMK